MLSSRQLGALLASVILCAFICSVAYSQTPNVPDIAYEGRNIKITWAEVNGADGYKIYHGGSRLAAMNAQAPIATVNGASYTHTSPNVGKYENHYRIVPSGADGEQTISFEQKLFGETVLFYDPKFDDGNTITADINGIHERDTFRGEFTAKRHALYLKPGEYKDFGELRIGFYTSFSGLGALPTDTKLYGSIAVPPHLGNNNATCTFWRSVENFALYPTSSSDSTTTFRWAVSQAAPARRLSVNIPAQFDWSNGWASGGFLSDSRFTAPLGSRSQQQWYTRNSHFGHSEFYGDNWNRVTHGVTGNPYTSNWESGGARTNIETVPVIREKPFLFLKDGEYKVFLPTLRRDTKGITWNDETNDMGKGTTLDLEKDFYVAKTGDSAAKINAQLNEGKHIFFTPGWYDLEVPLHVTRAGTVLLGSGYATLFPEENNREGAIFVDDVPSVTVASLMLDAHFNSKYLIRLGEWGASKDHSDNPSLLADVFLRVGGYKNAPVNANVSVQINSNNVIGDHLWVWRADHGRGVSWTSNTADYGLIVSGNDVTMYGLFVEHYQKYQTLWLGENGKTFFYQNELPYDPTEQSVWKSHSGTVNGWAAYKVGNNVKKHSAIGLGCYGVFNRQRQNPPVYVYLANSIEVPNTPDVTIRHVIVTELGGRGGTSNIVNGTGESVGRSAVDDSEITSRGTARRLVSYNNGKGMIIPANGKTPIEQSGVNLSDEELDFPK